MVILMRTQPSLLLAALLTALPLMAQAAVPSVIVPPPMPPAGVAAPAGVPAVAPPPAAMVSPPAPQIDVLPPDRMRGAVAPVQPDLIDVVLPAAPERPAASELKPKAPSASKPRSVKSAKPSVKTEEAAGDAVKRIKLADDPFAGVTSLPVSDAQLNRFVFQEPVEGIYFPEGAPLPECPKDASAQDPCKPVFLNGRRMMLLQLRAGATGPIQMLAHLHSGRMLTLNLMPARGPGAVIRIEGAEDGASDARLADARASAGKAGGLNASEQDVALLARFARGDIPGGFEPMEPGTAVRYDLFDVVPMATWSNGSNLRVHLSQVRAFDETPVALTPGLFRRANIKAVALDRESSTEQKPALLYLLEQLPVEMQ